MADCGGRDNISAQLPPAKRLILDQRNHLVFIMCRYCKCIPKSSFTFLFLEDKNHILVRLHVDVSDNVLHFASVGDKVSK